MQSDYSVTIFSRHRGKTRTFSLNRRSFYVPVVMLIILVAACILLGKAYLHEREERQLLEGRIVLLEQLANKIADRSERQGGEALSKEAPEPATRQPVKVARVEETKETSEEPRPAEVQTEIQTEVKAEVEAEVEAEVQLGGRSEAIFQSGEPVAKIADPKVGSLDGDRAGFRFDFKLVNLIGEPITGNVAIIASLRPPHQPRFVSFPSMQLADGMPVKLRKSVGFNIRYFKYVTGRFYFPFSYSESFRILVYNRDSELILDSILNAEDVAAHELVTEEPAPSIYPSDPSLSS